MPSLKHTRTHIHRIKLDLSGLQEALTRRDAAGYYAEYSVKTQTLHNVYSVYYRDYASKETHTCSEWISLKKRNVVPVNFINCKLQNVPHGRNQRQMAGHSQAALFRHSQKKSLCVVSVCICPTELCLRLYSKKTLLQPLEMLMLKKCFSFHRTDPDEIGRGREKC